LRAAGKDQLGGDFRARAERADADPAAREFLGDHAHRFLAEPESAEFLRNREREHAEFGHLGKDRKRDVFVLEVPALRVRHYFLICEAAHLAAHGLQRLVETRGADGRGPASDGDGFDQPCT
jgi:hypothetical protein